MIRAAILSLLLAAAPATAQQSPPVDAVVSRDGDQFVAEFSFPHAAPAWGFFRSNPAVADSRSWRARSWTVLTPGVALERRGRYDALVATNGQTVPARVRVRFTPFTQEVEAQYVPALLLGGRSVALFDGHFSVFSVSAASVLDELGADADPARITDTGTKVRFDGGRSPFRLAGDVEGYRSGRSSGTYGLFDVPRATVAHGVATVIDTDMPAWFAAYVATFTPQAIEVLGGSLGPSGIRDPTILAAWEGAERAGGSMNGGALKGLILMRIEGRSALTENSQLRDMARWFIAHEASHFWLGQAIRYEGSGDSWIMEGGADLLAARTIQRIDPTYSPTVFLNDALRDCAKSASRPVAQAPERGEQRTTYACGTVFALVAERAGEGDFFGFVRGLIDHHRGNGDINSAEWLQALDRVSGKPELSRSIGSLLRTGAPNPNAALADLLSKAGIPFTLADGLPQL